MPNALDRNRPKSRLHSPVEIALHVKKKTRVHAHKYRRNWLRRIMTIQTTAIGSKMLQHPYRGV